MMSQQTIWDLLKNDGTANDFRTLKNDGTANDLRTLKNDGTANDLRTLKKWWHSKRFENS